MAKIYTEGILSKVRSICVRDGITKYKPSLSQAYLPGRLDFAGASQYQEYRLLRLQAG